MYYNIIDYYTTPENASNATILFILAKNTLVFGADFIGNSVIKVGQVVHISYNLTKVAIKICMLPVVIPIAALSGFTLGSADNPRPGITF